MTIEQIRELERRASQSWLENAWHKWNEEKWHCQQIGDLLGEKQANLELERLENRITPVK